MKGRQTVCMLAMWFGLVPFAIADEEVEWRPAKKRLPTSHSSTIVPVSTPYREVPVTIPSKLVLPNASTMYTISVNQIDSTKQKEEPEQIPLPRPLPKSPSDKSIPSKVPEPKTEQPQSEPQFEKPPAFLGIPRAVESCEYSIPAATSMSPVVPDIKFGSPNITISKDYPFDEHSDAVKPRGYVRAEYLNWWMDNYRVPPLATTSPANQFPFLGLPGTRVLFDSSNVQLNPRNGMRISAGTWLNDCQSCGVDGSIFFLSQQGFRAQADFGRLSVLGRPFFAPNPNINREFAELVAFPGIATGGLRIDGNSSLWGADLNLKKAFCNECDRHLEGFLGFRYLHLGEGLSITEFLLAGSQSTQPQGTLLLVNDTFNTRNQFYGGQIGARWSRRWDRFFVETRTSVALGVTNQSIDITGSQIVVQPGMGPQFFTGGLLTTPSNIGHFNRNTFSVVPEGTLTFGYHITPRFKALVGYNALYWSSVLRPGDQIDRVVDVTLVPNPPTNPAAIPSGLNRPAVPFRTSDVFVHGVNLGLEWSW